MTRMKDRRAAGRWGLLFGMLASLCAMGERPVRAISAPPDRSSQVAASFRQVPVEDRFVVRLLPNLSGSANARAISNTNVITGWAVSSSDQKVRVFRLPLGGRMEVGNVSVAGAATFGIDVNDAGEIVGQGLISQTVGLIPILWQPGSMPGSLGTFGGASSTAAGINNAGTIVGFSETATSRAPNYQYQAYLRPRNWTGSTPGRDLGTLGGSQTFAVAINDLEVVVGSSDLVGGAATHAFRHSGAGILTAADDLGTLGGSWAIASDINNTGTVVGGSRSSDEVASYAFRHVGSGKIQPTDSLGILGGRRSIGTVINDLDQVIGSSTLNNDPLSEVPIVWDAKNGMRRLDSLASAPVGVSLALASGMNDAGLIVGNAKMGTQTRGYLAAPLPTEWLANLHARVTAGKLPEKKKLRRYLGDALRAARTGRALVEAGKESKAPAKLTASRKAIRRFTQLLTTLRARRKIPVATAPPLLEDAALVSQQLTNAVTVLKIPTS